MKSNEKGHIVFLTSVAAISGFNQQLALSVSQFAIQGFYESIVEELRVTRLDTTIKTTLVHIYPCIAVEGREIDSGMRVPGFFGSIKATKVANAIIDGVRKNKTEISIPKYFLFVSQILKIFPKRITLLLRDFLDTGLDF
jgi:all-trans-retinol dehydrogenase (NAD+)